MLSETIITCLEALTVVQTGGGFIYWWCKRDSRNATIMELRDRGMTIDQLAQSFDLNRNTIVKILQKAYGTPDIKLDNKSDWLDRYEAWCQSNDKHVEEKSLKCACSACVAVLSQTGPDLCKDAIALLYGHYYSEDNERDPRQRMG